MEFFRTRLTFHQYAKALAPPRVPKGHKMPLPRGKIMSILRNPRYNSSSPRPQTNVEYSRSERNEYNGHPDGPGFCGTS